MNNYKKITIATATILTLSTTMAGCSAPKEDSLKQTQQAQTDIAKKKVITDIEMTPKKFTYKQDDSFHEKGKELTVIPMHIVNKTKSEFGVGAGDFHLETKDGKKIETFGYHDSFGDVVSAGKTLDGNAYFAIPKDGKDYTLVYHPTNAAKEQTLKWTIGLPKK